MNFIHEQARHMLFRGLLAAGRAFLQAVPAGAASLTAAKFMESISGGTSGDCPAGVGGSSIFAPDTIDRNCPASGGFSSGHARTTGGATPTITLDLAASGGTDAYGRVEIVYEIALLPKPGAPVLDFVPADVHAFGHV